MGKGKTKTKRPIKQPLMPWAYVVISLVSLVIGVILLIMFNPKAAERLTSYIIVVLTGFSAAAFLFGVLRSYAWLKRIKQDKKEGKTKRSTLELGGPVVLFFIIVGIGLNWVSENNPFDFTIFLRDTEGKTVLKEQGLIHVRFETDPRTKKIDENGSVDFKRIPAQFKDRPVPVELEAPGWQFTNDKTTIDCVLKGNGTTLIIKKNLCCLSGRVRDGSGNFIADAAVIVKDIEVKTDKNGWFKLEIPSEKQEEDQMLIVKKQGYKTHRQLVHPGNPQEIEITLKESDR
jgi:hypothetical protein